MNINTTTLIRLCLPMMLVALSNNLMGNFDKMVLARLDVSTMSFAMIAQHVVLVPFFGLLSLAGIVEVFVGRLHGAKQDFAASYSVWQMFFLSLSLFIISVPCALYLTPYLIPANAYAQVKDYFQILFAFFPLAGIMGCLSGFYVGIGRMRVVVLSIVVGNIIGIFVDWILVLGYPSPFLTVPFVNHCISSAVHVFCHTFGQDPVIIPSIGSMGAAIGTICGHITTIIFLLIHFLSKSMRDQFHTHKISFSFELLKKLIKIGFPNAISHSGEMIAWTLLLQMITWYAPSLFDSVTIPSAISGFLIFTTDGLQKGVISLTSNVLGRNDPALLPQLKRSIFRATFIFSLFLCIPLLLAPEFFLSLYGITNPSSELIATTRVMAIYFSLDMPMWTFAAILTSGGDTNYIMRTNLFSSWVLSVFPMFILLKLGAFSTSTQIWLFYMIYVTFNLIAYWLRYRKGKWIHTIHHPGMAYQGA